MSAENERSAADSTRTRPLLAPFWVDVHHVNGSVRVAPVGEMDAGTVGQVEERLRESSGAGTQHQLVLDLRGLKFMDSTGVHLILNWHALAVQYQFDFALIAGPPAVQRVLEVLGLTDRLPFRAAATDGDGTGHS